MTAPAPTPPYIRSLLCLIIKNERQDLLELIAHHCLIGFERIVIYDNESDDGTAEVIEDAAKHFPVERILWQNNRAPIPGLTKQGAAYTHCITEWRDRAEWICFLDGDEFLIPPPGAQLNDLLDRHADQDAFAINWMTFGSSNLESSAGRLVLEAFTGRGAGDRGVNQHVKIFFRPNKAGRVLNPHYVVTEKPAVSVDGRPVQWMTEGVVAPGTIVQGDWRIHHYIIRSREHWTRRLARRQPGGQARDWETFKGNDASEIPDYRALASARKVHQRLTELGYTYRSVPTDGSALPLTSPVQCTIDEVSATVIRGWAYNPQHEEPTGLIFRIDGQALPEISCTDIRPDVAATELRREKVGFHMLMPSRYLDGSPHTLTVTDTDGQRILFIHNQRRLESKRFKVNGAPEVISMIDSPADGCLRGWVAAAPHCRPGHFQTRQHIKITHNNQIVATGIANIARPDVAAAHDIDRHCGFAIEIPLEFRQGPPKTYRISLMPEDIDLNGSPITADLDNSSYGNVIARISAMLDDCSEHLRRAGRRSRKEIQDKIAAVRDFATAQIPTSGLSITNYEPWFVLHQQSIQQRSRRRRRSGPLVSIVCPVYRPAPEHFRSAILSLMNQTYQDIEILLCDDGGKDQAVIDVMAELAQSDSRIRFVVNSENRGISETTNTCLDMATGEWVAFFDHDDLLVPHAIEVMVAADRTGHANLIYSDEDKIDDAGNLSEPMLKPAWNYRYLLGVNYINHLTMIRRDILDKAGRLDSAFNGAQDHDFLLRCIEFCSPRSIVHVPAVLYHWRKTSSSTASSIEAKPYAIAAGVRAVQAHLHRRKIAATVYSYGPRTFYRVQADVAPQQKVAIVIPYKDQMHFTRKCVERLLRHSKRHDIHIFLVNNGSTTQDATKFADEVKSNCRVTILEYDIPFNYSAINNFAVSIVPKEYENLILMNNDLFVSDDDWLDTLMGEMVIDPTVGIVGGKYLFENRTVQHCGVILGFGGVAGHAFAHESEYFPGYGARGFITHQVSAVTAACLLIRRDIFDAIGGFDEKDLTVAFNDIDLCIKATQAGWKIILTPDFVAEHHESISRGLEDSPKKIARFAREQRAMKRRWKNILGHDPFFHPAFAREGRTFHDLHAPAMGQRQKATILTAGS
ncbi:glycosyltransferase [Asaia sp. HumB]|nr:glycosyltransferase [Asaia sp. HumB]MDL2170885.1 glycosyltransferase [Asaia sp. HumB]